MAALRWWVLPGWGLVARLGSMSAWWYVAAPLVIPLVSIKALPPLLALVAGAHLFGERAPLLTVILPAATGIAVLITALWWLAPLLWNVIVLILLTMN